VTSFQAWIERTGCDDGSPLLPLTHLTRGVGALRIVEDGRIVPQECKHFKVPLAYFFYGRPAYRVTKDSSVQLEASCPCCFVFSPKILSRASKIHAFDTGAFFNRLYSHVLDDQFKVEDFALADKPRQIKKLISAAFDSVEAYLDADRSHISNPEIAAEAWEMEGRAYLSLLMSPGRNEPDDRICSVEVTFADPVLLDEMLLGIVVPHTLWNAEKKAPFIQELNRRGVIVRSYRFIPGRHPEFLQAQLEAEIKRFYTDKGLIL
jgi:hypothetical protein